MSVIGRCACGEFAPIVLIERLHGIDAEMCERCFRAWENRRFDEASRLTSPHRQGCRLCPLAPCEA